MDFKKARGRKPMINVGAIKNITSRFNRQVTQEIWDAQQVTIDPAGQAPADFVLSGRANVTKEQIQGLTESSYKIGQKQIELRAQKEIKELSLKSAMDNPEVDRTAIDGIIKEIGEIDKVISGNRAELMIAERETLTGEHFDKLKAVKIGEAKERRRFLRELALRRPGRKKRPTGRRCGPGDEA